VTDIRARLQQVFREVFDDPELEFRDDLDANSVEGWDSLGHIHLIVATERAFGIRLTTSEIARLKQNGETAGTLVRLIERRASAGAAKG